MAAPDEYRKLPAGVRCRCLKLWREGDDFYCCTGATAMAEPMTELDKLRAEYVRQIIGHVRDPLNISDDQVRNHVDSLIMEWGAKAYQQGRQHMAARIKKCADDWTQATS